MAIPEEASSWPEEIQSYRSTVSFSNRLIRFKKPYVSMGSSAPNTSGFRIELRNTTGLVCWSAYALVAQLAIENQREEMRVIRLFGDLGRVIPFCDEKEPEYSPLVFSCA